jgi:hypothetical protein
MVRFSTPGVAFDGMIDGAISSMVALTEGIAPCAIALPVSRPMMLFEQDLMFAVPRR